MKKRLALIFSAVIAVVQLRAQTNISQEGTDSTMFFNNGLKTMVLDPNGALRLGNVGAINGAALLQLNSTSKGLLIPRMTTAQRNAITTPPTGLIIYNTSAQKFNFYDGSSWSVLLASNGNFPVKIEDADADTKVEVEQAADEDFIRFNVSGTEAMVIDNTGNVGVGISVPTVKMDIDGELRVNDMAGSPLGSTVYLGAPGGHPGLSILRGDGVGGPTQYWQLRIEGDEGLSFYEVEGATNRRLFLSDNGDLTINESYTFPQTDGNINEVLTTDGVGNVTWQPAGSDAISLRGTLITTVTPTDGKVLRYNSASGEYELWDQNADFIQGSPVSTVTANDAQVLQYNGGSFSWEAVDPDAVTLRGTLITTVTPTDGKVLRYNSASGEYELWDQNADYIQGFPVSTVSATTGDVLSFNGGTSLWEPVASGSPVFETSLSVTSNSGGDYINDDFVFGSPSLDDDADPNHDARFIFDKSKGAFRAGFTDGTQWDEANLGAYSIGLGYRSNGLGSGAVAIGIAANATANFSVAIGQNATASGNDAKVLGTGSTASGQNATAIGFGNTASGATSIAIGDEVVAPSRSEIVVGAFNTTYTPASTTAFDITDRQFVVGNGQSDGTRSDALVVLKGGEVGIGVSTPLEKLHLESGALMMTAMTPPGTTTEIGRAHV